MQNKVLNKHCFIKRNNRIYCSKCGKIQMQDTYNLNKHVEFCHFSMYDINKVLSDRDGLAYAFYIKEDKLYFYGYLIELHSSGQYGSQRFQGWWKNIFKAIFSKDGSEIAQYGRYDVDFWLSYLVKAKKIDCLNADNPIDVVAAYFHNVVDIYDWKVFLQMYRQGRLVQKNYDVKKEYHMPLEDLREGKTAEISLFEKENVLFLKVDFQFQNQWQRIIFSDGFCYTEKSYPMEQFLKVDLSEAMQAASEEISRFNEKYPYVGLELYCKTGGKNILAPIVTRNYRKCFELVSKAGLGIMTANLFDILKENHWIKEDADNVKEMFGISVAYLRKVQKDKNLASHLKLYKKLYKYNPSFIDMKYYSQTYIECLYANDLVGKMPNYRDTLDIDRMTEKEILHILRYLDGINAALQLGEEENVYVYYRDYIRMCKELGDYSYGLTPKNLMEVHDVLMKKIWYIKNGDIERRFHQAIAKEEYLSLASDYVEPTEDSAAEQKNPLEKEAYQILLPTCGEDLEKESRALHHCVAGYINGVSEQKTYILFLRKKAELEKPYATIEVLPDKTLVQLKAVNNTKVSNVAMNFVKKWAKVKGITIRSHDID